MNPFWIKYMKEVMTHDYKLADEMHLALGISRALFFFGSTRALK